ncbi:UDP-N-acetylmuramoylalanine--D-glutamate ligase [Leptospira kobayashii]|uniref:UDP-N-acetylmuramoylalanine--D-glutamate ligase n=1 Tax=Leptospira kobayashii TaxID=1917830 RepID=A0ABN6KEQ0_9LEPT|nr:UDP-N-acetylmuramoyl-L-alanine--D-glutamate ligase [Leptospira kobayashii]BDA78224.1 UDP-N-acetylmuramoylalanine--D-glutamate ligase [Leptospira kobayashii]
MFSISLPTKSSLLSKHRFLILGGGLSGESAARLLSKYGKTVILADQSEKVSSDSPYAKIVSDKNIEDALDLTECIIKSPGISPTHPILQEAEKRNLIILSEIALGRIFYQGPLVGITGTDGKSTTTALTHHLIRRHFPNSQVGGNLGLPFTSFCEDNLDMVVLELSSYQLEDSPNLHLSVSAITNLAPDHLERHKTMERYLLAKWKSNDLENPNHTFIIGKKVWEKIPDKKSNYPGKILFFGEETDSDIFIDFDSEKITTKNHSYDTLDFSLPGKHNLYNLSLAIAISEAVGVPYEKIKNHLGDFEGLPHRFKKLNLKGKLNPSFQNLEFINDSKSTNLHSMLSGLSGFKKEDSLFLILGGEPKEESLGPFFERWKELQNPVWIYGKAGKVWKEDFSENKKELFCEIVPTVKDALKEIKNRISPNEKQTILFSPACASFDLYKNFSERGKDFERLVQEIFGL